jgi:nitrate/TMAO reductase-like tetraheme cytochrome c subunit
MVDCYSFYKVGTVGPSNRQGLSTECSSCHMDDFKKVKNPNHIAQGFSTQCQECHSLMDNWMTTISPMMLKRNKGGKAF